jgi:hypothetical protein
MRRCDRRFCSSAIDALERTRGSRLTEQRDAVGDQESKHQDDVENDHSDSGDKEVRPDHATYRSSRDLNSAESPSLAVSSMCAGSPLRSSRTRALALSSERPSFLLVSWRVSPSPLVEDSLLTVATELRTCPVDRSPAEHGV